jgi:hypothetical protein
MMIAVMGTMKKRNVDIWNIIVISKIHFVGILHTSDSCSGFPVEGLSA